MTAIVACLFAFAQADAPKGGYAAIFNGRDLTGWHAMATIDPRKLAAMSASERKAFLDKHAGDAKAHWKVENGELVNDGHGAYLTTDKEYGDVTLLIDYKTVPKADSGIYLRATPQVQIWDPHENDPNGLGKKFGSGGLWNNSPGAKGKDPLAVADNPLGEWNHFQITQLGARTTVFLNGKLVVDDAVMENYWDRKLPLCAKGPIQLQTHGGEIRWRNVVVREIPAEDANRMLRERAEAEFTPVFNGQNMDGWAGPVDNYEVKDGAIVCKPGKGGTIYTKEEFGDFTARVEFRLPPGGNNGLAIRYPGEGDPAYVGMCEVQVLDDGHPKYARLDPRQAHGSAYGMAAAARGYLRPTGEWNFEEVTVKGSTISVTLNGTRILDADLAKIDDYLAKTPHPGKMRKSGHFGFAGHGDAVEFRRVAIKRL